MIRIPIIFGWIEIHNKEQIMVCEKPILVAHWVRAGWMKTRLYSKRLFCFCGHTAHQAGKDE